jgi:hypothetical protein
MPQDDPRTVLHGIDQSCPFVENLPGREGSFLTANDKGNMASECYVEEDKSKHIFDADVQPLPGGDFATQIKWLPMEYVAFRYEFEEQGGAEGVHNLRATVPAGTILIGGVINTVEAFTSGGAPTFELWVESAGDILASAGYANVQA